MKIQVFLSFLIKNKWLLLGLSIVLCSRLLYVGAIKYHHRSPLVNSVYTKLAPKSLRLLKPGDDIRRSDALLYDLVARALTEDGTFRIEKFGHRMVLSPGFPLLLGILYQLFGRSVMPVLIFYAFLEIFTILLLLKFLKGAGLHLAPRMQALLLVAFACYIPYMTVVMYPVTEGLFSFLLAATFVVMQVATSKKSNAYALATGVLWGLAALTRPIVVLFPFLIALVFIIKARFSKESLIRWGGMCLIFVLTLLPWTVRNYVHYDRFILITSDLKPLIMGTDATGTITRENLARRTYNKSTQGKNVVQVGLGKAGEMLAAPHVYVGIWMRKLFQLWLNIGFANKASIGSLITAVAQAVIIGFSWFIFIKRYQKLQLLMPAFLLFGYVTFFHVFFFTTKIRFILPFIPVLLLISIYYLSHILFRRFR